MQSITDEWRTRISGQLKNIWPMISKFLVHSTIILSCKGLYKSIFFIKENKLKEGEVFNTRVYVNLYGRITITTFNLYSKFDFESFLNAIHFYLYLLLPSCIVKFISWGEGRLRNLIIAFLNTERDLAISKTRFDYF